EATDTISDLTTGGMKTNSSAFTTAVAAGTHLWAGLRTALASTQPTMNWVEYDLGDGFLLQTAGAGALTGSATFAGAAVAGTTVLGAPNLGIRLD
ncbi:hypothetical protein LRR18_16870, partial [Mangrovimonas sp. AS39]|uniref:hypothetical protein n=1 Tax=Mangrovimonas futianensis TaxID=2895523 RepID=UPI001E5560D0